MAKVFLCGRSLSSVYSGNFLYSRNCLATSYQSISKKAQKRMEQDALPPKPKRPANPFVLFLQDMVADMKQQNPDQVNNRLNLPTTAANAWLTIDPAVKDRYRQRFDEQMEIFHKNNQKYKDSLTEEQKKLLKKQKTEQKYQNQVLVRSGKPLRPKTSFVLFMMSERLKSKPTQHIKDWMRLVAEKWKSMTEEEKEPFKAEAAKLRLEYERQLKAWQEGTHVSEVLKQNETAKNKNE